MNKIIFIIFVITFSIMTNYAMKKTNIIPLNFPNFTELYVEYTFTLGRTCSTPEELHDALLPYEDTSDNRKIMKAIINKNQPFNNKLNIEQIIELILKKNNISDSKINESLQEYQQKSQKLSQ